LHGDKNEEPHSVPVIVAQGVCEYPVQQSYPAHTRFWLGIDPGESNGLAAITMFGDQQVRMVGHGTYNAKDLLVLLRHNLPHCNGVGLEEFRLYSTDSAALSGSDLKTSQIIGAVIDTCARYNVPCSMQPPSVKKFAWTWAANRWPSIDLKGATQHEKDAKAHAIWQIREIIYERKTK
jgi:hypothetical protein